jgi:hypothetical protein
MEETFTIGRSGDGVVVTRTTRVRVGPSRGPWRRIALFAGLKHVRRFVFGNWARQVASVPPA